MMIPKRVFVLASAVFTLKLVQRGFETLFLQKIDYAPSANAIDVT